MRAKEFAERNIKIMKQQVNVPSKQEWAKRNFELMSRINYKDMSEKLQELTTFVESRSSAIMSEKSCGYTFN